MKNNAIIFHLEMNDHSEIYVNPNLIPEISGEIEQFMRQALSNMGINNLEADVMLVAADRGSLRLAFVTMLRWAGENKDNFEGALKLLDLVEKLQKIFGRAVLLVASVGGLALAGAAMTDGEQSIEALVNDQMLQQFAEQACLSALKTGADKLTVSVPDMPDIEVSLSGFKDPRKLGGRAPDIVHKLTEHAQGELRFSDRLVSATLAGSERQLPVAKLTAELGEGRGTRDYSVLVDWQSSRDLKSFDGEVYVQDGVLTPLRSADIKVTGEVTPEDRWVAGVLTVKRVRVYE